MELKSEIQFPAASPLGKGPLCSFNWRLVGLQSRTVGFGEENICCVFVSELHFKRFVHIPVIRWTYSEIIRQIFIRNLWHWCGRIELFFLMQNHMYVTCCKFYYLHPHHMIRSFESGLTNFQSFQEHTGKFPVSRHISFLQYFTNSTIITHSTIDSIVK
jgi:hypothetical protein